MRVKQTKFLQWRVPNSNLMFIFSASLAMTPDQSPAGVGHFDSISSVMPSLSQAERPCQAVACSAFWITELVKPKIPT